MSRARAAHLTSRMVVLSALISFLAVVVGVALGPATLPLKGVVLSFVDALPGVAVESGLSDAHAAILWELRLPRVVLGFLVGALLSMAGGAYQGVFRNPLADPYLLGVAAGAGLAATLGITTGLATASTLPVWAFVGALAGVALTYGLGSSMGAIDSTGLLILSGVAVAAFLTAIQTYVQQQNADSLREVYSWILGRLTTVGWAEVRTLLPYGVVAAGGLLASRRLRERTHRVRRHHHPPRHPHDLGRLLQGHPAAQLRARRRLPGLGRPPGPHRCRSLRDPHRGHHGILRRSVLHRDPQTSQESAVMSLLLDDLSVQLDGKSIVSGVTFDVAARQWVALIGMEDIGGHPAPSGTQCQQMRQGGLPYPTLNIIYGYFFTWYFASNFF